MRQRCMFAFDLLFFLSLVVILIILRTYKTYWETFSSLGSLLVTQHVVLYLGARIISSLR